MSIKRAILAMIAFLIIVLFGFGLIGYYAEQKPEEQKPAIYSLKGVILEIQKNNLKLETQDSEIINILIDQDTKIVEHEIAKIVPRDAKPSDLVQVINLQFSDLKIGDEVIVSENSVIRIK